jgi:hypothetical protein
MEEKCNGNAGAEIPPLGVAIAGKQEHDSDRI